MSAKSIDDLRLMTEQFRADYARQSPIAERLATCLRDQITALMKSHNIILGVPMESRIKSLESIEEKIKRKSLVIANVSQISDIVGVRIILLFLPDLHLMDRLIHDNLDVLEAQNATERLGDSQFGYQSNHYTVRIPEVWQKTPSYADLGGMSAEIQVRTVAQHIWAAASHAFQYKHEQSVPLPLRRTINRVSALLETIDLEFGRVLSERSEYIQTGIGNLPYNSPLDVDLVQAITAEMLPQQNAELGDQFDLLLLDLVDLGVSTAEDLRSLLSENLDKILAEDHKEVKSHLEDEDFEDTDRLRKGVFFTHVGLVREALRKRFGDKKVNEALLKSASVTTRLSTKK